MTQTEGSHRATLDAYFAAMRRGSEAEDEMMALFAEDATYAEPFSGVAEPANGKDEILERLRQGWDAPLPDMELDVLGMEIAGDAATSLWECRSSAFQAPVRGEDRYTFDADGRIARLEVRILDRR